MPAKRKHLRIVCPHCGKRISLAPPRARFGWVRPVPCPSCHIPINPAHIKAQLEPPPQATASEAEEVSDAEAPSMEAESDQPSGDESTGES